MNPKTPKLLRDANSIIRIAVATKSLKIRREPSKNRGKQVRTPKPMNAGRIVFIFKDVESQKLRNGGFT